MQMLPMPRMYRQVCPAVSILCESGRKSFMLSTKHFADLPNQSPQSSNHCTDVEVKRQAIFTV